MGVVTKSFFFLSQLTEIKRHITRSYGTEAPYSGKLLHNKRDGLYHCLNCHTPLFCSGAKYDSGCGWPSFSQPLRKESVKYLTDISHNMERMEIRCSFCDAHLGHVFPDGPQPTGERYCVNSASMSFTDGKSGDKITG